MKNRATQSEHESNVFEEALSVKTNEAHQAYISNLEELESIFKDVLKDKSITIDFDSKNIKNQATLKFLA